MKSNEQFNTDTENLNKDQIDINEAQSSDSGHEKDLPDSSVENTDVIAKMEAELTDIRDKYLRLNAEFDNYKKRVSRDRIEQSKMAGADIFLSILPIIDDMERAIKSAETTTDLSAVKEGLMLIFNKLKSSTEAKGLKAMVSVGQPFDADLHDAIANVPAPSEDKKGMVLEEVEKGFFLNDKVIRHAKVIVAI